MKLWSSLSLLCLATTSLGLGQTAPHLNIMPLPASSQLRTGQLIVDQSFTVALSSHTDPREQRAVERFLQHLSGQTGIPLPIKMGDETKATLILDTHQAAKEVREVGEDESYQLEISPSGAKLSAPTLLGTMHGLQTFLQLVQTTAQGFATPAISIQDRPRFPWRGLLIDVGRHFMPLAVLKRNLDGMAAVKLNVLHLHISDDQGFRIESKNFPKLQEMGSDGLYYTQDQMRDLIAYARDRGIRVLPEFDIPGHSIAAFVGYPELASGPGPYSIERTWGVHDPAMDPTKESTYKFLDIFIGEMAKLFPDRYFHIGGDEVSGKHWDANPKIQEFKRAHAMKNNQDLQAYFNQRLQKIITKHGKIMVGWDEILHPDLPKESVIQSWRGQESLAHAAKQGYGSLLSYGYYLDLMWPASQHYAVDPMADGAAGLSAEEKQRVFGGEACMWGEYVSSENIDSRVWPRAAVIAERLWSPSEIQDVNSMYRRAALIRPRLEFLGLTHDSAYPQMLSRIAGSDDIRPVRILADVLEPTRDYSREELATTPATSLTPMNRLVDAVHPESDTARHFSDLVNVLVSGKGDSQTSAKIRQWLTKWQDNGKALEPLLQESFLLKEAALLSQNLSALSAVGLQALDYIEKRQPAPAAWKTEQMALIQQAKKPKAQVLLMIAPSVEKLVSASPGAGVSADSR